MREFSNATCATGCSEYQAAAIATYKLTPSQTARLAAVTRAMEPEQREIFRSRVCRIADRDDTGSVRELQSEDRGATGTLQEHGAPSH